MRPLVLAVLATASLVPACAGSDSGGDDVDDIVNCDTVTDDDDFVIGLHKDGDGGLLGFTLMSGDPAPPIRGDNSWVIQVDAGGTPVSGAAITVTPFMPQHGHGAGKTVLVQEMPDAGQYQLSPVNLWMPGVWETTIDATTESGEDQVVFRFCIPS
jgi:hypothetical protein